MANKDIQSAIPGNGWSLKGRLKDLVFKFISLNTIWAVVATVMLWKEKLNSTEWVAFIVIYLGLRGAMKVGISKNAIALMNKLKK